MARHFPRCLTVLFVIVALAGGFAANAAEVFRHRGLERDAARFEGWLQLNWKRDKRPARRFIAAGERLLSGKDPRGAWRQFAQAAVNEPKNDSAWHGLARGLLAIPLRQLSGSERYRVPVNASGAAYLAFQRARSDTQKANALVLLANALERRSYWRPAIEALRGSLRLADAPEVAKKLEALQAAHGFRITNYNVENESSEPELCIDFSESLKGGDVDFAKYIAINGKAPQSVRAQDGRLCVKSFKHGETYEVLVRGGLPAAVDETLAKNAELSIYVRDRSPTVRFTGRSYVLPSRGQSGLPIVSINTDEVGVEIYRIGDRSLVNSVAEGDLKRQLSDWELRQLRASKGVKVWSGALKVRRDLNKEITTALPVGEAVGKLEPGVYAAVAWADEKSRKSGGNLATQWFIVSDLGLTAYSGQDGVHAFVRSLATAQPVAGSEVRLVARNNEVLVTGKTDARGYVRFDAGFGKGEGGMQPALLVARNGDVDYAFLDLSTGAFDLTDRGVEGRQPAGPVDGFIYLDRGVYRPGEQVFVSALVRDDKGGASDVPVTVIVTRPDGVEHNRIALTRAELGGHTTELTLASGAMTGTWRLALHTDPAAQPIARGAFLVEDFVPERLALELAAIDTYLAPLKEGRVKVTGRYLYGPPAAGLAIDGEVVVAAAGSGLAAYPGYHFGMADEHVSPVRAEIANAGATDKDGQAVVAVALPKIARTARPLKANITLRLKEPGGRAIERNVSLPVRSGAPRLGIKPLFEGDLGEGETASFDLIAIDGDEKQTAMKDLSWELVRLQRSWQWYKRDGTWMYEAVTVPRKIAAGKFDARADQPLRISEKIDWGRYRLDVRRISGRQLASSYQFNAGWYASDDADSPEMLAVALDKASYKSGDTAKLKVTSRVGGTLMVAVMSNGLVSTRDVALKVGDSEVEVPVGENWGTGAYIIATLYRSLDEASKRMPGRAMGVAWLGVDQGGRTLKVGLDAAQKVRSGSKLDVPIEISGLEAGEQARVTVAAVDVGVLNLTRFASPAPTKWFYAQPLLGAEVRDLYGRLIDGMRAERGALKSGGDADGGGGLKGAPPVEETLALFSGIVTVGDDGRANVSFEMPDFNGSVRLMAVAWSGNKIGEASQTIIVRDRIALTTTAPRFLTLGDNAQLMLDLHNVELDDATLKLVVARSYQDGEPVEIASREVKLTKGERRAETLMISPDRLGLVTYDVFVTGANGVDVKRDLIFDVKPPAGNVRRTQVEEVAAGGSLTVSRKLLADLIPDRAKVSLSVGPAAGLNVPSLLSQLDRYPYGCAEQTISRALPLLYANELSLDVGMQADNALEERIQKAADRVFDMQDASGGFGVWGPSNADIWLTSYVTDFLTRARERGVEIDTRGFSQALARLQNYVAYVSDFTVGGTKRAYALYVLARNGRAPIAELRYYADARLDRFSTPTAKAQIGAALAMVGDRERAESAFNAAIDAISKAAIDFDRIDFGSSLRDAAAVLTLASETRMVPERARGLTDRIAKAYATRTYTSTQEQAWLLLAARSLGEQAKDLKLAINGKDHDGRLRANLTLQDLSTGDLTITNRGSEATQAVVTVSGDARTLQPATANGFEIERQYYTLDGAKVELGSGDAEIKQTDRLVAVLTIKSSQPGGRVLLVDRLPAGLEIENPRLIESGSVSALSWFKPEWQPDHTEFRDDRFVAAFDFFRAGNKVRSATVAYIVRAVSPGRFVHPAAMVEDMYRPERYARTAAGSLTVKAR